LAPAHPAPPRTAIARRPAKAPGATPHYHGHRERLRARLQDVGADALADYELLELLLFRSIPRSDTKGVAKALIARFGDLGAVFAADPARIVEVEGVGPAAAQDIAAMQATFVRIARLEAQRRPIVSSWTQLLSYCTLNLQHATREEFHVLFLDRKNQLIRDETMSRGTVDQAPAYPREIVRRALELSAAALILVHNHPSGDPHPSQADIAITREIAEAARVVSIALHDHVIIGRHGTASFKTLGLL
jgi:DNA repair protein RadC